MDGDTSPDSEKEEPDVTSIQPAYHATPQGGYKSRQAFDRFGSIIDVDSFYQDVNLF